MNKAIGLLFFVLPLIGFAQNAEYQITSYHEQGTLAPNTHYIGEAWLNSIVRANEDLAYNITKASFKANSTLDWHKHTTPQVLVIVQGEGYYQERGKEAIILRVGDVITCKKNTEHWHASTKDSDVTYLAIYGGSEPTIWTEVLSQEYYDSVAKSLKDK